MSAGQILAMPRRAVVITAAAPVAQPSPAGTCSLADLGGWLVLLVLSAADCQTTSLALAIPGMAEDNPLGRTAFIGAGALGLWGFTGVLLGIAFLLFGLMPRKARWVVPGALTGVTWPAVLGNLLIIARFG